MKFPLALGAAVLMSCPVWAAPSEPTVTAKDLPRVPAVEPDHALETFKIKPGFRLDLVAAEPLVTDPVALSFDENGRLFVAEMRDYSERRDEHLGRIRMLEDTDGDGRFDKSTVYAEDLAWPTAVICYDGGVFVAATPDIIYLKDTNGDGIADVREVVFTGFGAEVKRLNVQQLLNSFAWGLDNRIHGANGGNGGVITSPKRPQDKPLELRGRDFSFDPRTFELRAESGGGQYGMSFDDRGRKFICNNSSHIRLIMYEERYVARNPFLTMPPPALDIAVDGAAAEVYRISPDEPWRVLRTKWRVAGLVPGPVEGGGRPSGYFTSATGLTIYRGDAWPDDFHGDAFIADCGSNLVHRKRLLPDGVGLKAERAADEQKVEFLASRDLWFRPVQMGNAPDGGLYVMDMYREVIEHPWSFPASIKEHLDLNSGNDRGRVYRIVPEGYAIRRPPRLGQASPREWVRTLEHANGWHRDTAARLLYQRQDRSVATDLRRLLKDSKMPLARMHALYVLDGMGALATPELTVALSDSSPIVRQHALRLAEGVTNKEGLQDVLQKQLPALAEDADPLVRYQLAFSLGSFDLANRSELLLQILRRSPADAWMQLAVLNSLTSRAGDFLAGLLADSEFMKMAGAPGFLRQLSTLIGARHEKTEVAQAVERLRHLDSASLACSLGSALGEGLQRAGSSLSQLLDPVLFAEVLRRGRTLAQNAQAPEEDRLHAVKLLGQGRFEDVHTDLRSLLQPGERIELQRGAIRALSSFSQRAIAEDLLSAWETLTPSLRIEVVEALLRRPERLGALLNAIESGKLRRTDLSASQIDLLRRRSEPSLLGRIEKDLGPAPAGARADVVKAFAGSLSLEGNAERGRIIYTERCASCHRLAGQGNALGPDLETVRTSGRDVLLGNILDPNREVMPKYVNYLAETADGESLTGLVVTETDSSVVLRQPNGKEATLLRSSLSQFRSLGQSAMPEGLEEGLSKQALADLMEYVLSARP